MPRTQRLTIRLLKLEVREPEDALTINLHKVSLKGDLDFSGAVFFRPSHASEPKWLGFVNEGTVSKIVGLKNSQANALLVIKAAKRYFAVSFGNSWQWLDESKIERRFGLIAALNCISDEKIKTVDAQQIDSLARSTRAQISHSSEISSFGLDVARDLMKAVSGRPSSTDIGTNVMGSDALRISCKIAFPELGRKCSQLLSLSRKETYREKYSWIDNIEPVKSNADKAKLDAILVQRINSGETERLYLSAPRIRDLQADDGYKFHFDDETQDPRYDLEIDDLIAGVSGKLPIDIAFLKKRKIEVFAGGADMPVDSFNIYSALVFEAPIGDKLYCLIDGEWYKVSEQHVAEVNEQLKALSKSLIKLPQAFANEKEGDYNIRASGAISALCLDKKLVVYGGARSKIEICDILTQQRDFIHVKRSGGSNVLSHLFNQGVVSAQLLLEPQFRALCEGISTDGYKLIFADDFPADKTKITYGIISKAADKLPGNLPFFSKQTLVNAVGLLQKYRYRVELLGIKSS
jgi:uncharacterized protein (TIGR04141 family)